MAGDGTGNQILTGTPAAGPITLAGDVSGLTSATSVDKLKAKPVTVPLAADDLKFLQYSNSGNLLQWANASAGAAVTMGGDVSGQSSAASVDKAKGVPVPAPVAGDDQKALVYLSGSTSYALKTPPVKIATKTANYTLSADDMAVLADASGGAFQVSLPAVAGTTHRQYLVKKIDTSANAVTIAASGAETIDGANTAVVTVPYTALTLVSSGTAWFIL